MKPARVHVRPVYAVAKIRKQVQHIAGVERVVKDGPYSTSATIHTSSIAAAERVRRCLDGSWVIGNGELTATAFLPPSVIGDV